MNTTEINLYPIRADHEIEIETLWLYLILLGEMPPEQREYLRMTADRNSGWIITDDFDPELVVQCVDGFAEAMRDANREIQAHVSTSEDKTLDQLA